MNAFDKFELYEDILLYIYQNDIISAIALLSDLPYKPRFSEASLVKSALRELENQQSQEPIESEDAPDPDLAKYSSAFILTTLLLICFCVGIVIHLIGLKVEHDERILLNRVNTRQIVINEDIERNQNQRQNVALAYLANTVIWYFLLIIWMRRRYVNIIAFGTAGREYSTRWAWLGFVIPILNAWRPYQVAQEIWKASDPDVNSSIVRDWKKQTTFNIVSIWWLGFFFVGVLDRLLSNFDHDRTIEGYLINNTLSHISHIIFICQLVLTIIFIDKLSSRQNDKFDVLNHPEHSEVVALTQPF